MPSLDKDLLIERLSRAFTQTIDMSLDRIDDALDRCGGPHRNGPAVIHVAGTNGKGGTVFALESLFLTAGYSVLSFTTPHVRRMHECYRLDGRTVGDAGLIELSDRLSATGVPLTLFEAQTGLAFLLADQQRPEVILLECGMGGRDDATNIAENKIAAVITNVGLDHTEYLGDTIPEIARVKTGIFRPGVPALTAAADEGAIAVLQNQTDEIGTELRLLWRDWSYHMRDDRFTLETGIATFRARLQDAVPATHLANFALAATTCTRLGIASDPELLGRALESCRPPGRYQELDSRTVAGALGPDWTVVLDVAHNAMAAHALAAECREHLTRLKPRPELVLVLGMQRRKRARCFLRAFRGIANRIYTVNVAQDAWTAEELAEIGRSELSQPVRAVKPAEALPDDLRNGGDDRPKLLLATGSFTTVALVKAALGQTAKDH